MSGTPSFTHLLKHPTHLLAFGFGAGLSPKAPGTAGTLIAIPIYLALSQLSLLLYLTVLIVIIIAGIWICDRTAKYLGVHDHSGIVWDEIAGFLITMIAIPLTWWNILLAFALFRFFDIVKPWPIRWLDRHVQGGFGIMLDDIVAGMFTWAILCTGNFIFMF
jgi:phosphatidylglycerophosphatase A